MFLPSPVLQSTEPLCTGAIAFEATHNEQGVEIIQVKTSNWKYFVHLYLVFLTRFISVIHRAIYNTAIRISVQ